MKKNIKEIIGVLSLSLILVSTFSVSACLPEMLKFYKDYSRSSIENLISIPAMAMVVMIILSPIICKWIDERIVICTGLVMIGTAGCVPFFITSFPIVFATRILLGLGIGLVNTRAVSLVGERFSGEQRMKLMGIRMSMESLGQAAMTFVAGLLLAIAWNRAFLVYLAAFLILVVYLLFVPGEKAVSETVANSGEKKVSHKLSGKEWIRIMGFVLLNGTAVSASTVLSLRVPNLIVDTGIGTATGGATVLSISVIAGFFGGLAFGKLMEILKKLALPVFAVMLFAGLIIILVSGNIVILTVGAAICGFFITEVLSYGFQVLSESTPKESLDIANAAALVGCNLGSSLTPLFLQGIDRINGQMTTCFWFYGILVIGVALLNIKGGNRA